jgi:aspartyl-tRNA(Asn)/glutamyl-tRNA(Gln) amidotransferase subunit C
VLSALADYARQLQEVDISAIEPTTHVLPLQNVFREDKIVTCLPRDVALALAPESEDGFYRVPSIL